MLNLTRSSLVVFALGLSTALQAGTFNANFNDGQVPIGSQVFGNALVESPGGVGDTACLKLTKSINLQAGAFIIEDLDGGANVYGFRASLMARIGGGTATPADGWSFSVAPDILDGTFGQEGTGSGLSVCFDTYVNTDVGETFPTIDLKVGGQVVASRSVTIDALLTGNDFAPVIIAVNADGLQRGGLFLEVLLPGLPAARGMQAGVRRPDRRAECQPFHR